MPNHIKNRVELVCDIQQLNEIIQMFGTEVPATLNKTHDDALLICKHKTEEHRFCWLNLLTGKAHDHADLNQIGLPADYEPEINQGFFEFPDFKKVIPPPDDPAYHDQPSQKEAEKSPNWWYKWNIQNWGTKWGGYAFKRISINTFKFETAWSPVPNIMSTISKAFPELTMNYTWADEDSGFNCGRAVYKNGLISENRPEGGSKDAYDIYFELNPDSKSKYKLVGSRYEYVEQED